MGNTVTDLAVIEAETDEVADLDAGHVTHVNYRPGIARGGTFDEESEGNRE